MRASDETSDDLGRTAASMLNLAHAVPDMIDLWRVLSEIFATASSKDGDTGNGEGDSAGSSRSPVAIAVRANALLANNSMRYLLRWQQVVTRHLPRIRRDVEEFKAAGGGGEGRLRDQIVDDLRAYLREMAELPCDQCRALRDDIEKIERDILPHSERQEARTRRHRAKP